MTRPMWTRRNYEMVAEELAQADTIEEFTRRIAARFAADNPAFDRARFFRAVQGLPHGPDRRRARR